MTINATRLTVSALATPNLAAVTNVTRAAAVVLGNVPSPEVYVTRVGAIAIGNLPSPEHMVTRICCSILASRTPLYNWIDMIVSDVFPNDISYNSVGSIRFATDVTVVDSGADQRTSRWDQPLMEYDIAYGVRTMEQLQALIAFFRAVKGRLYAFLYLDHLDFTSSVATAYEARSAPPISATDQVIGAGDGSTKTFQLSKTYSTPSGAVSNVRPILCPNVSTVTIAFNGVVQGTGWSVNSTTGIVTFTAAPASGVIISAGYQFYVPCRFDTDTLPMTLEDYGIGSAQSIKVVEVRPASF